MIADDGAQVGIIPTSEALRMGGANSEMDAASTEVLLEIAVFRPGTIRKTARRLSLPSEASYRFERGVDQVGSVYAMGRVSTMDAPPRSASPTRA